MRQRRECEVRAAAGSSGGCCGGGGEQLLPPSPPQLPTMGTAERTLSASMDSVSGLVSSMPALRVGDRQASASSPSSASCSSSSASAPSPLAVASRSSSGSSSGTDGAFPLLDQVPLSAVLARLYALAADLGDRITCAASAANDGGGGGGGAAVEVPVLPEGGGSRAKVGPEHLTCVLSLGTFLESAAATAQSSPMLGGIAASTAAAAATAATMTTTSTATTTSSGLSLSITNPFLLSSVSS